MEDICMKVHEKDKSFYSLRHIKLLKLDYSYCIFFDFNEISSNSNQYFHSSLDCLRKKHFLRSFIAKIFTLSCLYIKYILKFMLDANNVL